MNLHALKESFKIYLEAQGKLNGTLEQAANLSDVSIFTYADEFRQYLKDEFSLNSSDINSKSISDILQMDIVKEINSKENEESAKETDEAQGEDNEDATLYDEILCELLSDEDFSATIDSDNDGEITQKELEDFLEVISAFDGEEESVSVDDLLLAAQKIYNEEFAYPNEADDEAEDEDLDTESSNIETAQSAAATSQSAPVSTGSSSPSGSAANTSSAKQETADEADTIEEIKKEISSKKSQITSAEQDAKKQIAELEDKKQQAMKEAGISNQEYEQYQQKEEEFEKDIDEKDNLINAKDDEIRGYSVSITSNNNYITSLNTQISANKSAISGLKSDDENAASKKAAIEAKIAKLEAEVKRVEAQNRALKEKSDKAELEKEGFVKSKKELESQKEQLLSTALDQSPTFGLGKSAQEKESLKAQITKYDEEIKEVKAGKDEKVSALKDDIEALEVKLKDLEEQQTRDDFIKENRAFTTGEDLAECAKNAGGKRNTTGWCLAGVNTTLKAAYGITVGGASAYMAIPDMDNLVKQGKFEDITGNFANYEELKANCPEGAVIVWERSSSSPHGHICVTLGPNNGEVSDHFEKNLLNLGTQYHVYYPTQYVKS